MNIDLKSFLITFRGALMCKLQRCDVKTDYQPKSTQTLLFVAWKSESDKKFRVVGKLLEHVEPFYWSLTKLEEYYQIYANQLSTYTGSIKDTWLTDDGKVLMTELKLNFMRRCGVLDIIISEGIKDEHTKRSILISPEK
jgi:hypothetical protein